LFQWYGLLTDRREHLLHEVPYVQTRWAENFTGTAHGDD